ncbi:S41 family peptidase [Psychroserpens sp.]|uniref:S41 family peptidase n=1 Tax=Psychroserpens sp. TaxID=2020870 RepID=UPI003C77B017
MLKHLTFAASALFCVLTSLAQTNDPFCNQVQTMKNMVLQHHYQPKVINDSLSTHVFDLFLENLDDDHRLFTEEDIKTFELDRYEIDNYIQLNLCFFIEKYATALTRRIKSSKKIISALEDEIFDYSGRDTLRFKPESTFKNLKDDDAIQKYWSKRVRYNILYTLIENDSILEQIKTDFKRLEANLKPKLIQKEICKLEELQNRLGSIDNFVKEAFLNAYLHYHDPNSTFFNTSEKEMFESSLSNDQYSFGMITSKNEEGDIVVVHLTPGGAAFIDGSIEENDVIKSISSTTETLETYCVSNQDVLAFLSNQNHKTITFRIKKQNGTLSDVELTKSISKTEDNSVTGYVIEQKSKVGYINIPSFYSDFETLNGRGLASDVAKELYKLQKENIEGLILDLRFNGGGSMKEAAELSGMFINRGPLAISRYNNGETSITKDLNRGALFTKPMVILVNNYSASASEFFAATMQDYNRAIIVGASTHGKASAQVILPLGTDERLGFVKLTVEKFYRVTGKSHQSQGVIPDILLSNLYDNFKTQERFEPFALQNDAIDGVRKFPKLSQLPLEELRRRSMARLMDDTTFKSVEALNALIIKNYFELDSEYLLTLENVYHEMTAYRHQWEIINQPIIDHVSDFAVINSSFTNELSTYSDEQNALNKSLLQDIKEDIYIEEAHAILLDALELYVMD